MSRLTFGVLAILLSANAATAAQLGEVAKKEEARRKTVKASGKKYTNDNLRPDPTPSRPVTDAAAPAGDQQSQASSGSASSSGGTTVDASEQRKKDEAYWRKRIQEKRDALQRLQLQADAMQTRINSLTNDFTSRDDPAQRAVIGKNREQALAELGRLKQEIEQQSKAITEIQEEGRRAGVPAGWLR